MRLIIFRNQEMELTHSDLHLHWNDKNYVILIYRHVPITYFALQSYSFPFTPCPHLPTAWKKCERLSLSVKCYPFYTWDNGSSCMLIIRISATTQVIGISNEKFLLTIFYSPHGKGQRLPCKSTALKAEKAKNSLLRALFASGKLAPKNCISIIHYLPKINGMGMRKGDGYSSYAFLRRNSYVFNLYYELANLCN